MKSCFFFFSFFFFFFFFARDEKKWSRCLTSMAFFFPPFVLLLLLLLLLLLCSPFSFYVVTLCTENRLPLVLNCCICKLGVSLIYVPPSFLFSFIFECVCVCVCVSVLVWLSFLSSSLMIFHFLPGLPNEDVKCQRGLNPKNKKAHFFPHIRKALSCLSSFDRDSFSKKKKKESEHLIGVREWRLARPPLSSRLSSLKKKKDEDKECLRSCW